MNFRNLRTFVTIADAGGVARAATLLNLSQPAASRQIYALEAELGVKLFDRIGRRVQLTSEGEDLAEQIIKNTGDVSFAEAFAKARQRKVEKEDNEKLMSEMPQEAPDLADLSGISLEEAADRLKRRGIAAT